MLSARRSPAVHKYFNVAKGHSRALLLCIIHNMQSSSLKTAAARALITPVSLIMSVLCFVDTNARWPFFCGQQKCHRCSTSSLWLMLRGFSLFCLMDRGDLRLFFEGTNYSGSASEGHGRWQGLVFFTVFSSQVFTLKRFPAWSDGTNWEKNCCDLEGLKENGVIGRDPWKYLKNADICHRSASSPLISVTSILWMVGCLWCSTAHGHMVALKV